MSILTERVFLKELTRWVLCSAALLLLILCGAYVYLSWETAKGGLAVIGQNLMKDMVTALIPLTFLFLASSLFFQRYSNIKATIESAEASKQLRGELEAIMHRMLFEKDTNSPVQLYDKFDDVDWINTLSHSSRLDIIVHYLDSWTRHAAPGLQSLLENGGTIRVIVPNYNRADLVSAIHSRLPRLNPAEVAAKIRLTHEHLLDVLPQKAAQHGQIETSFVNSLVWYSAFCVDNRFLFLSPYEHGRALRIESPVTRIDLDIYPTVRTWLDAETGRLMTLVDSKLHT